MYTHKYSLCCCSLFAFHVSSVRLRTLFAFPLLFSSFFIYIYKKENWLIFKASSEPTKNPTDLKKQWLSGKRGVSENKGEKKGGNSSRKCESHPGVELPLCAVLCTMGLMT